mmetsp:Transcript_4568/g.7076  ORF Transcript_4568/g.7076 Transcript_4568/m.7076 type:complete len:98 (-) Transcript_4568:2175-2468(-)
MRWAYKPSVLLPSSPQLSSTKQPALIFSAETGGKLLEFLLKTEFHELSKPYRHGKKFCMMPIAYTRPCHHFIDSKPRHISQLSEAGCLTKTEQSLVE